MNEISIYNRLTSGTSEVFKVLREEIGMKTTCAPFAIKLCTAMKEVKPKTEQEAIYAADVILSGLQTLSQGGICAEDYDKIDFIKRGGAVVASARVEAFLRAAARKGYRITDTIVPVPKEDGATTYFKENFYNGEIIYTLEDARKNLDREVTAERLVSGYFERFICRLEVHDVSQGKRLAVSVCEMTPNEILAIAATSEQGIYKSDWVEYTNNYGYKKKKKVITDKLNTDTFWVKWTGEMVNKTIIRRSLKRVKEVLPELAQTIYAFEKEEEQPPETKPEMIIDIPLKEEHNINLKNLSDEQKTETKEMFEIYAANPKLAMDKANEIKKMLDSGIAKQEIINSEYASIAALKHTNGWKKVVGGCFDEED